MTSTRRNFLTACAAIMTAPWSLFGKIEKLPAPAVNKVPLPSSIALYWVHKDDPKRQGRKYWNISCQRSCDQFRREAVEFHALLASQNYHAEYREFTCLKFPDAGKTTWSLLK